MSLSLTIVIPTLNCAGILTQCLDALRGQTYPNSLVDILVIDGGSIDDTVNIAERYNTKIIYNPLKTGEAAKALGIQYSQTDIIAFIDSDNILPDSSWITRMMEPFQDQIIVAAEPIAYTYRPSDGYITRYCALMGMNDPLCYYLGNYDRWNTVDQKWTRLSLPQVLYEKYTIVLLSRAQKLPTIGANGTLIRTSHAQLALGDSQYYFDIDGFYQLCAHFDVFVAKVHTDIIHIYAKSLKDVWRKQNRRINDYYHYQPLRGRSNHWREYSAVNYGKFVFHALLFFPLFNVSVRGFMKTPDLAWFAHIPICVITLITYCYAFCKFGIFGQPTSADRTQWRQVS